MPSVVVLEVLLFNFHLDNKPQNVKTDVVRKIFNENGIGMFLSINSEHYLWVYFVIRLSAHRGRCRVWGGGEIRPDTLREFK